MADPSNINAKREELIRAIVADGSLTGLAVRVGVFLACNVNAKSGFAWPCLDTIAASVGGKAPDGSPGTASVSGVVRAVTQLEKRGYFTKWRGGGRPSRGGDRTSNRYFPVWRETVTGSRNIPENDDGPGDETVTSGNENPDRLATKTLTGRSEDTLILKSEKKSEGLRPPFDCVEGGPPLESQNGNNGEAGASYGSPEWVRPDHEAA